MSVEDAKSKGRSQLSIMIAIIVVLVVAIGVLFASVLYNRAALKGCTQAQKAIQVQNSNLKKARSEATDVVNAVAKTFQNPEQAQYLDGFLTVMPEIDEDMDTGAGKGDEMVAQLRKLYQDAQISAEKSECNSLDQLEKLQKEAKQLHDQARELSDTAQQLQKTVTEHIDTEKITVQARHDINAAIDVRESVAINAKNMITSAHNRGIADSEVEELVTKLADVQALPATTEITSAEQARQAIAQAQAIEQASKELDQLAAHVRQSKKLGHSGE